MDGPSLFGVFFQAEIKFKSIFLPFYLSLSISNIPKTRPLRTGTYLVPLVISLPKLI